MTVVSRTRHLSLLASGSLLFIAMVFSLVSSRTEVAAMPACGGICEISETAALMIWPAIGTIILAIVMFTLGLRGELRYQADKVAGTFTARRVSGSLGEVGDLDFHIPPSSEAPLNLVSQSKNETAVGSDSEFKNPFEF